VTRTSRAGGCSPHHRIFVTAFLYKKCDYNTTQDMAP